MDTRPLNGRKEMPVTPSTSPLLILLVWVATGCADHGLEPVVGAGALRVSASTSGSPTDPDGYTLSIDGRPAVALGARETLTIGDLPPGNHHLALSGISEYCDLEGPNPFSFTVSEGDTLEVELQVACGVAGPLEITTQTQGGAPDSDGYLVFVDATLGPVRADSGRPVPPSGMISVPNLRPGSHLVLVGGLAANCAVVGQNLRDVHLAIGVTTRSLISLHSKPS